MSDLTNAQEKDYTRQITGILIEYTDAMKAKDVDPTARIGNLNNGANATDAAEAAQVKTEEADKAAIGLVNKLRTDTYKLAQASVGLIEGALGKDHPAAVKARSIRGEMSNPAARGPRDHTTTTTAPAAAVK
jgi:hypothetical protein